VAAVLVLVPALAAVFSLAPFPAWLVPPMALGPLALLLVDTVQKRLRQRPSAVAVAGQG
jgi:hypothetical protein